LTVKVLASPAEQASASRFLASLVIARVPLFLFQAVQASLLPKLAGLAGAGRHAEFRRGLSRLLTAVLVVVAVAVIGAWTLGPWVVRLLFGEGFELGHHDLGLLAAASGAYMVALTFAQALIALSRYLWAALGWLAGVVGFIFVTAVGSDLILRAELGFLAGSLGAAAILGLLTLFVLATCNSAGAVRQEIVEP
jgi:O-antigen/teichoic acid export membrane protein